MMLSRRRRPAKGFTFLEIMFVVVIIGILLALVGPRLLGKAEKARKTATEAQIHGLESSIKNFELDMGRLPKKLDELVEEDASDKSWDGPYVDKDVVPVDGWKQDFNYKVPGEHNKRSFDLWSNGPDKAEGTEDDIGNWTKKN